MAPPTSEIEETFTKPCIHHEKKCTKCGQTFIQETEKNEKAVEQRRKLSSGTFYGTFMKSIDEHGAEKNNVDDSTTVINKDDWLSQESERCTYLVKYSVNGVFKGQTRFSYDFDDKEPRLSKQSNTSTSSLEPNSENESENDDLFLETEEEGEITEEVTEKKPTEIVNEQKEAKDKQEAKQEEENGDIEIREKTEKEKPQASDKRRNFSVKKQHSLNEYRLPDRKASSSMQKKLSLFTNQTDSVTSTTPKNGLGSRQSSTETDEKNAPNKNPQQGMVFNALPDAKKKQIQQQLLEGMFKYAEQKYGRKKPASAEDQKRSPMEDYELYLRSLKIKVKSSSDKVAAVMKQKREIDAKLAEAEKEQNLHQAKYDKAEDEKKNAVNESRDPVLPKDFIVPQRVKSRGKAAGLGAIVMKASSQNWQDKFNAKRSKKNDDTPEWAAKQKKTDKTSALLNAGRNKMKEKKSESNKFPATTLNKTDDNRTRRKNDEQEQPKANVKKTETSREEDTSGNTENNAPVKQTTPQAIESSSEESEEEEEEDRSTFRRRRNRIPRSDDEEFDI